MQSKFDLIVIGAGSGGLVAAATASGLGASVLLIENRKMGGDCLNYGCVPSKTFLKSCHLMKNIKNSSKFGIDVLSYEVSLEKIMSRVKSVISEIAIHDSVERFESLGVKVIIGHGEIVSNDSVKVGNEVYKTKKIIISTGSSSFIPNIIGINDIDYLTNETIFDLKVLPKKMLVLGAGPIGLELGQGFAELGCEVHIIEMAPSLFRRDEPEVAEILTKALIEDGVNLHFNSQVVEVAKQGSDTIVKIKKDDEIYEISCDAFLVAPGRSPNTKNLGLENVGIKTDKRGFIEVNDKMQTSVKNIYACGDVRGKYLFTHTASYEASIAVKNALILPIFKSNYRNIAWTTYTSPEVAHVGVLESEVSKDESYTYITPISNNDRSKSEDDREGFVKLVLDKKRRLIGATIVGDRAGEMILQLSVMISKKLHLSSALNIIYQYPAQGEIVKTLAVTDFKEKAKPWQKSLMKKIVSR